MLWIPIRIIFGNPDPHQIRIMIRIRINLADNMPKCMEYEPIWRYLRCFFKGLSLYLEARIWIRIRIKFISRIRIPIKVMRIRNTVFGVR